MAVTELRKVRVRPGLHVNGRARLIEPRNFEPLLTISSPTIEPARFQPHGRLHRRTTRCGSAGVGILGATLSASADPELTPSTQAPSPTQDTDGEKPESQDTDGE